MPAAALSPTDPQAARWRAKWAAGRISAQMLADWEAFHRAYGRREEADYVPPTLELSLVSGCNLRCPTCQIPTEVLARQRDAMPLARLAGILDRWPASFSSVILVGGEPLLHPHFGAAIALLEPERRRLKLFTNGVRLGEHLDSLARVHRINVSLDAWDAASYHRARGGSPQTWERVLGGLWSLRQASIPFGVSALLSSATTRADLARFVDLAGEVGAARVKLHNVNGSHNGLVPLRRGHRPSERLLEGLLERTDYPFDLALPHLLAPAGEGYPGAPCVQPWNGLRVDPAGHLRPCCHLPHDVRNGSVDAPEPLNGAGLRELRRAHVAGALPPVCVSCPRRFFRAELGFFSARRRRWERPS